MSGDCIKMRTDLSEDPAVIAMAMRLKIDEFGIVGRLHKLWSWADTHLSDGHAVGVSTDWIDHYVHCDGFSKALLSVGWLGQIGKGNLPESGKNLPENLPDGLPDLFPDSSRFFPEGGDLGGVVFPKFFKYQEGKALTTKAKTKTTPTRESEIGKEIGKESLPDSSRKVFPIRLPDSFPIFWDAYPRKDSKNAAKKAFEKIKPNAELFETIMAALDVFKRCDQWTRDDGKFINYASSWLNQRRWEDLEGQDVHADSQFADAL